MSQPKASTEEQLVEAAFRKLCLSRAKWQLECLLPDRPTLFRLTHLPSRRHVDGRAAFRTHAEQEPAFLKAVSASMDEILASLEAD
jgi:hypothetical protein